MHGKAREWPAFHLAVYFIDTLLAGYGTDERITNYLSRLNFYVFPVLNPDGFIFSRTSKKDVVRQWRKNRAPANCSGWTFYKHTGVCCDGVDLNRNWDIGFKQTNYPFNNPCSDEFQGPFPFSEPETRAVRDFVLSNEINGRVHAMVSMHTHGQLFILPFNYHRKTYPKDYADLESLALRAASAIGAEHGTEYRVGTAADMLGPATGGATDWIKQNTNIKYVYVIELPPELRTSFAFQMRPHWLLPTAKETWRGIRVIVEQVLHEFK
ncbi:Protein W01A8.6 [Aphelenchoides avenae]|nr:Protein W01A8.6 [Aphelenchus avenae]